MVTSKDASRASPIAERTMMHDDSDSDASSEFMSPFQPFRMSSLIPKTPPTSETLPKLQDKSWLGASMSPINSFDDEDLRHTAPYRKALHDSLESSFVHERTLLLGGKPQQSRIHPLWDQEEDEKYKTTFAQPQTEAFYWGRVVCIGSGIHLGCIGIHDLYLWYISYRLGMEDEPALAWRWPWLSPSELTLIRFGAFVPEQVLNGQPWRCITSFFMSTSILEWILVLVSWRALRLSHRNWFWVYLLSVMTGQSWMTAWEQTATVSGCVSWGTCGVLCAAGVATPSGRFAFFMLAIAFVLVGLLSPFGSPLGTIGGSFFGWAFYGSLSGTVGIRQKKYSGSSEQAMIRWLCGGSAMALWIIPVLFTGFRY